MANKDAGEIFLGRPGGMCGARGRDREGVIRSSRPRILELSCLGLIRYLAKPLIWNLACGATCGGAAEHFARSAGPYLGGQ